MKMNKFFSKKKTKTDFEENQSLAFYKDEELPTTTEVPVMSAHSADTVRTSSMHPPSLTNEDDSANEKNKAASNRAIEYNSKEHTMGVPTSTGVATATAAGVVAAQRAASAPANSNVAKATNQSYPNEQYNVNNHHNQDSHNNPLLYDMSRKPICIDCPSCGKQRVFTRVKTYPSWETVACGAGLALAFWPIFWIPFVVNNCKQTDHYCMQCGAKVGQIKPMRDCCMGARG